MLPFFPSHDFPSHVLIAGCGYLGRAVGALLIRRGVSVYGICRSQASVDELRSLGIHPVRADLSVFADVRRVGRELPQVDGIVLCQSPSKGESYLRTYYRGTQNVLEVFGGRQARVVFVSSTSVCGDTGGAWVNEWTPAPPVEKLSADTQVLAQTELMVRRTGGMVLRLAGLYGPGRHRAMRVADHTVKLGPKNSWMNRIHRDDAASAVVSLLERGALGNLYLGVDDEPTTQETFYTWIYQRLNMTLPAWKDDVERPHKRCSNLKLKSLGWKPEYPTFREAYAGLIERREVARETPRETPR